jgi:hypothetical protein
MPLQIECNLRRQAQSMETVSLRGEAVAVVALAMGAVA